jgi:hypothetical protein
MNLRISALVAIAAFALAGVLGNAPAQAQFAQQGPKLVGTNARSLGFSASLSGDGNTAIVGGPAVMGPFFTTGAAWVFTRSGGVWGQQQEINGYFFGALGFSVSLSADGNTAIVGVPEYDDSIGFAEVYVRSGGVWTSQATLYETTYFGQYQGSSVSLSADGNTAIVGAPGEIMWVQGCCSGPRIQTGAARVFTRTDGEWTQQAKLIGIDSSGMFGEVQGSSVALSGDGNTALVNGGVSNSAGEAGWVFTRSPDGGWTQQAILTGGGGSVSLSNDGNAAILGNADGAVVYARQNGRTAWNQEATLAGTGGGSIGGPPLGGIRFGGFSVSLSADGNTAMVGTSVYTRSEVGWTQQELPVGTGAVGDAAQGFSVALSGDGHTALVGGPEDNSGVGAAWAYSEFVFPGTPGRANCHGQRTAGLAKQYGGLNNAAAALGFDSVNALQDAIMAFCEG